MGREFELKYRATEEQVAAIEAFFGAFTPISMETTYYDSPDRTLRQLHWTLRRRMENGISVCTLKTPLPDVSRGEWELECGSIEEAVPELCKLSNSRQLLLLTAGGIMPTCGAKFTRLAKTVEEPSVTVELALDRGILTGGGQELPFAEVEVEYKSGSEAAAAAFAGNLARQFGLTPEPRSKVARAMALAENP
jgi:inorganic triphosphatase YgiF